MSSIDCVTIEVDDPAAAGHFYSTAFDLGDLVRVRASDAPATGFRGFTLSLVVPQPATVRRLVDTALEAGATSLKPPARSLWGYGGVLQAPDGTIWTVASATKKDSEGDADHPERPRIDDIVLQLGVADVAASKRFYIEHGLAVARSFGSRYVEFQTGPLTLTLNKRRALAKQSGVPADGTGSHRLVIGGDLGAVTDPDGFPWEAAG